MKYMLIHNLLFYLTKYNECHTNNYPHHLLICTVLHLCLSFEYL